MMKKLAWIALGLLLALPIRAQTQSVTASLTAQSTDCTDAGACLVLNLPSNAASALIQLSGTWSATVQFEATANNGATWVSVNGAPVGGSSNATSSTGNGAWRVTASGFNSVRVRVSTYSSGTIVAVITSSPGSSGSGGGSGGG